MSRALDLLRAAPGPYKRSNSAWALTDDPGPVEVVARFYAERGLPPRVQVTGPEVDARLGAWPRHDTTLVLTGPLPGGDPSGALLCDAPGDDWTGCVQAVDGRPGAGEALRAQLALVRQDSAYAAVRVSGQVVAVGRGAVADGWLGVFGMAVLPGHRRTGRGRAVLAALGGWARRRGATAAYLQVGADNTAARELYAGYGLTPAYAYWYRTAPH